MATKSTHVYCFQLGATDCFKIGRSVDPQERKADFSTASPVELIERRREPSEHPEALETYIHKLLEMKRVKNRRELFNVTMQEVMEAFETAIPIVNDVQLLIGKAAPLAKIKPVTRTKIQASDEMLALYEELREAKRNEFLLQNRIECLESKIKLASGDNFGIEGIVSWLWRPNFRIDITKLRKQRLKLYELLLKRFEINSSGRRCKWA